MKKVFHILLLMIFTISGILGQSSTNYDALGAPPYNPIFDLTTSMDEVADNGFAEFQTTQTDPGDAVFILLGDGYFSFSHTATHQYPINPAGYTAKAHFNRRYKRHVPTVRPKGLVSTGGGNIANNKISMPSGTSSKIATSWMPVPGIENYFMLIFENISGAVQSGCLEFYYNSTELSINNANILEYNNWVYGKSHHAVTGSGLYDQKIHWNFSHLDTGEQRVVYVPATAQGIIGSQIHVGSKYVPNCLSSPSLQINPASLVVSGSPHDPNFKVSDIGCVFPGMADQQTITYTIHFQNEGDGPARNVIIEDVLDIELLDLKTINFVDSEYEFYYTLEDNKLIITFEDIWLPGLRQSTPKTITYDETASFIKFEICTNTELPTGSIENLASIFFDDQSPIHTDVSEVYIDGECVDTVFCELAKGLTSTSETTDVIISLSPNPIENTLTITGLDDHDVAIRIFNSRGELVHDISKANKYKNQFYLEHLPSGLYLVQVKNEFISFTEKLIKL